MGVETPRRPDRQPGDRPSARVGADEADIQLECRAYAVWIKQKVDFTGDKLAVSKEMACKSLTARWADFSKVATSQMGDHSAREPMKVVPSRDITQGRRKEPLNLG